MFLNCRLVYVQFFGNFLSWDNGVFIDQKEDLTLVLVKFWPLFAFLFSFLFFFSFTPILSSVSICFLLNVTINWVPTSLKSVSGSFERIRLMILFQVKNKVFIIETSLQIYSILALKKSLKIISKKLSYDLATNAHT